MQGLHCIHFLKHKYSSTPHPLFPTYPRTVRGPRASALLLFYTDQMNRVHSSEEAPRSFTMAPCIIVERLEGKQRCRRAAVSEHAGIQAREWSRWLFTRNEGSMQNNQPPQAAHHAITTAQRPDNTRLTALVRSRSTKFMTRPSREPRSQCSEIGFTFLPFSRRSMVQFFWYCQETVSYCTKVRVIHAYRGKGLQHLLGATKRVFSLINIFWNLDHSLARDSHSIFWNLRDSDYRQRCPLKSTEIRRYRKQRFGVLKFPLSPLPSTHGMESLWW